MHVLRERESAFSNTRPKNGHLKPSVANRLVQAAQEVHRRYILYLVYYVEQEGRIYMETCTSEGRSLQTYG